MCGAVPDSGAVGMPTGCAHGRLAQTMSSTAYQAVEISPTTPADPIIATARSWSAPLTAYPVTSTRATSPDATAITES